MSNRLNIVLCTLAGAALFAAGACSSESSSSTSSSSTSSSGSSSSTSSTGTGGTGGGGGGGGVDCNQVCNDLFDCGLAECAGGWVEGDRDLYLNGCPGEDGCVATCTTLPALAALVDPNDCPTTVSTISGANPTFKDVCDNGFTPCGTGGGGTGGAGGG